MVLGIDANDNVRDGDVTKALREVGMFEAVVSNHKEKSVPATCATNTQRIPIDSIWTSPGLLVSVVTSFLSMRCMVFSPITDLYGSTSATRICWDTDLNISIKLLGLRLGLMIQTFVRNLSSDTCYGNEDVINDFQTLAYFCQK